MSERDQKPSAERVLELVVYAPLGFALYAKDMLPPLVNQFVARGRKEVEDLGRRIENQAGQARILGQFAVSQGGAQVKRLVTQRFDETRDRAEQLDRTAGAGRERQRAPSGTPRDESADTSPDHSGNGSVGSGDSSHLPIPDYDALSASQVVARLTGLGPGELEAVRSYEERHRRRKTVLTKIDQLTT